MDTDFILKIVPMIIALMAIIVSLLISIYVTKKQLRASVNSKSRQEWINTLRDEITNYLFGFIKLEGMWFDNAQATIRNNMAEKPHSSKDLTKALDELQKHKIKISLLINSNEDDHKKLMLMPYGLSFDSKSNKISGWVNYNTYKTTKGGGYYIQIETNKN